MARHQLTCAWLELVEQERRMASSLLLPCAVRTPARRHRAELLFTVKDALMVAQQEL